MISSLIFNDSLFRWCNDEPNNWGGGDITIGEGCGQLKQTCLNDRSCSDKLSFVCRLTLPTTNSASMKQASGTTINAATQASTTTTKTPTTSTTTTTTTKAPTTTTTTPAKTNPNLKFDPELYLLE